MAELELSGIDDHGAGDVALGLVLHTGPRSFRLDESIAALPICALWG